MHDLDKALQDLESPVGGSTKKFVRKTVGKKVREGFAFDGSSSTHTVVMC